MKGILIIIVLIISNSLYSQDVKIKWEDREGRGFYITAPSGEFSYGMIQGDKIGYDYSGRVSKVGSISINYDYSGRISKVGTVSINYDYSGRVSKVGNLTISYDYSGRISGTSGSVNN